MIQPLRTAHERMFIVLAVVLPAVLWIGLGARPRSLSSNARAPQFPGAAHLVKQLATLWQRHAMQAEFYEDATHRGGISVVFRPAGQLNEPDLLLYWSPEKPVGESLTAGACLLGRFVAGKPLSLPSESDRTGYLVLYSVAHQTVIDAAKVEELP